MRWCGRVLRALFFGLLAGFQRVSVVLVVLVALPGPTYRRSTTPLVGRVLLATMVPPSFR